MAGRGQGTAAAAVSGVAGSGEVSATCRGGAAPRDPHVFKRGFVQPLISRLANLSFSQDHWLNEIERVFTVGKIPGLPSAN